MFRKRMQGFPLTETGGNFIINASGDFGQSFAIND